MMNIRPDDIGVAWRRRRVGTSWTTARARFNASRSLYRCDPLLETRNVRITKVYEPEIRARLGITLD
jgi:hypothetical protein